MTFAYATSHRIDEVGAGRQRKDLRDAALLGDARVLRCPRSTTRGEPGVYRELLGPAAIGPRCAASRPDWVVVERVEGIPLWQPSTPAVWVAVAAWVARMHRSLAAAAHRDAPRALRRQLSVPLLVHDDELGARWRRWAAVAAVAGAPGAILAAHERPTARLLTAPKPSSTATSTPPTSW